MPASHRSKSSNRREKHVPLAEEITSSGPLRTKSKKRKARPDIDDEAANNYLDSRSSRKILRIGQELQEEENKESKAELPNPAFAFESRFGAIDGDNSDNEAGGKTYNDEDSWGSDAASLPSDAEIDPADLDLFNKFNPTSHSTTASHPVTDATQTDSSGGTNLADLILEKIALHEATQPNTDTAPAPTSTLPLQPYDPPPLPQKVIEVYTKIGALLSRYKSGKLPKPLKILPTLPIWPDLLAITNPDRWTPNACYEATRIFISARPETAQEFLETVILPRVREEIREGGGAKGIGKKLNVHLYKALKRGLYKPAPWFKGFLFPLVSSGTCTLREASIVGSVLARVSVPVLHSAAALLRLTEIAAEQATGRFGMEAAGATNVFIRVLLEKKYALPYKVVDGLVFHFLRYRVVAQNEEKDRGEGKKGEQGVGKLPVLWHQCLLAFAQRYRDDITEDQREALLDLLNSVGHPMIGPEVRREMLAGRGRGVPVEEERGDGGDDTMVVDV